MSDAALKTRTHATTPAAALTSRALIALLLAFAAWIASAREADFDFWYNMAAGREILSTGRIGFTDSFTHTAAGHRYPPAEWLFQVMIYGLHRAFGDAGVVLYKTIFVTAWAAVLALAARARGARAESIAAVIALGLLAAVPRYLARPEWITFVGVAIVTLYALDEERGRAWRGWRAAIIPLVVLIWANAHPGVYFGIAILFVHALGAFVATRARRPGLIAAVCAAASFATPAFADNLKFLLAHANVFQRLGVEEFQPLPLIPELGFIWVYIAVAALLCVIRFRDLSLASRVLVPLFLVLAVRNARLVPLFVAVSAPLATGALERLLARRPAPRAMRAAAAALLIAACAAFRLAQTPNWGPIAFTLDESIIPRGAANFLEANRVDARLYNFQGYGNYLIWRGFKVATDARLPLHEETFRAFSQKPLETMARFEIDAAVVPPPESPNFAFDGIAGLLLRRRAVWAPVAADSVAMVFLKRGAGRDDLIAKYEIPERR
ncbi:MAG: hypothetical protein ACKVU1_05095 [bacterium]